MTKGNKMIKKLKNWFIWSLNVIVNILGAIISGENMFYYVAFQLTLATIVIYLIEEHNENVDNLSIHQ